MNREYTGNFRFSFKLLGRKFELPCYSQMNVWLMSSWNSQQYHESFATFHSSLFINLSGTALTKINCMINNMGDKLILKGAASRYFSQTSKH